MVNYDILLVKGGDFYMKNDNSKVVIIVLVIISLVLGGYIIYDKLLSDNDTIVDNDENNYNETHVLALGLSMYKYASGIDMLFHVSPESTDNKIVNYEEVAQFFTDEFIADADDAHICWPIKKGESYYQNLDCGFGGTTRYTYKSIDIKKYSSEKILYEVVLDQISELGQEEVKYDFEIINQDNIWKINKFTSLNATF